MGVSASASTRHRANDNDTHYPPGSWKEPAHLDQAGDPGGQRVGRAAGEFGQAQPGQDVGDDAGGLPPLGSQLGGEQQVIADAQPAE